MKPWGLGNYADGFCISKLKKDYIPTLVKINVPLYNTTCGFGRYKSHLGG